MSELAETPWNLSGSGYIILYKFSKNYLEKENLIPKFLKGRQCKGFGAIMLLDFKKSPIGAYQELLFIPSKFEMGSKKLATITKTYVSTQCGVNSGSNNWGILKELANFQIEKIDKNREEITVSKGKDRVASFLFKKTFLPLPAGTKLLSFPLVQKTNRNFYYTSFNGKGVGRMVIIEEMMINEDMFPNTAIIPPFVTVKLDPFNINLPMATIEKSVPDDVI